MKKQLNKVFYVTVFIEGKICIPLSCDFSYYARIPLNTGWRTTGGTRTKI
jgi:hypothetical protein